LGFGHRERGLIGSDDLFSRVVEAGCPHQLTDRKVLGVLDELASANPGVVHPRLAGVDRRIQDHDARDTVRLGKREHQPDRPAKVVEHQAHIVQIELLEQRARELDVALE
jgi:hypothetical protein